MFSLSQAERLDLLDNYVCSSYTNYRGTNRLKTIKLAVDYTIGGIPCKAGYPIFFDYDQNFENGKFVLLADDVNLNCNLISGNESFPFAKGTPLTFGYYGRIQSGILSKDFKYRNILLKARTKVAFQTWNKFGSLFWFGTIKHNEIIGNYHCLGGTEVRFEKGELQSFYPAIAGYADFQGVTKNIGEKCEIFPY